MMDETGATGRALVAAASRPPAVTVVIPTHNMARFILSAVRSVLEQSYQDLELVVVDDGSTDDTRTAVAALGDPRIRLVAHPTCRGPSAARNTGIQDARSEYVAFLDADDLWLPQKLERQMELLSRQPSIGFVYCGAHEVDGALRVLRTPSLGPPWPPSGPDAFKRALTREHFVVAPLSTMMLRKAVFDDIGMFDEGIVQAEEWDLVLRLAFRWDIAFVPEPLVLYRMTGHYNPGKRLGRGIGDAHETTIHRAFARLQDPGELKQLENEELCRTYWKTALQQYAVRQPEQARHELVKIATLAPDYLDLVRNPSLKTTMAYIAWGLYDTVTPLGEALAFVDYAFDHFPALVRSAEPDRRRIKSEVAAITAFDSCPRGERRRVWQATWLALLLDPSLFRNRGLLKLPFRVMGQRPKTFGVPI